MSDLPLEDRTDFENAERGRVDALDPCVVKVADGRVVWDMEAYSYLDADRPDTVDITRTGQEETVDGVRIVFQITPGTEAPAEMNFYFPAQRALCMAENATHNL